MKNIHIAVLLMVKNEHKRIMVTLESIRNIADSLVIYDTGSTDNTLDIIRKFTEDVKIPLRLKEGIFENFAISRNVALDFVDSFEDIDYILLMDVNDELRGSDFLRNYIENLDNDDLKSAYLVQQEWYSVSTNKYFNVRFIKARKGWRYKGVVHEYITNTDEREDSNIGRLPETILLYQDRTKDDDKSSKRFIRDEIMLKEEHKKNPDDTRTVFYLAQTYSCLNVNLNAYYYYRLRTTLLGFYEERYESLFKCGELSEKLGMDWHDSFSWYMKSYELINRVEPLLKIVEYYRSKNNWLLAYTFSELSCRQLYPKDCVLFIDTIAYEYTRWHLKGIVSYYAGFFEEGKKACRIAILSGHKNGINVNIDKSNLKIYEEKEINEKNQI